MQTTNTCTDIILFNFVGTTVAWVVCRVCRILIDDLTLMDRRPGT